MHFHIRGKRINRRIHKFSYLLTVLALVTRQTKHIVKQITPHIINFSSRSVKNGYISNILNVQNLHKLHRAQSKKLTHTFWKSWVEIPPRSNIFLYTSVLGYMLNSLHSHIHLKNTSYIYLPCMFPSPEQREKNLTFPWLRRAIRFNSGGKTDSKGRIT